MGDTRITLDGSSQLMRVIQDWLSNGWLAILFDLSRSLRQILLLNQQQGMYEILTYDAMLELLDSKGERAIFRKRQKVKFLQDNVIAFEDYAWGDGTTLADYKCSPGLVVDRYREGDRWNVLISLRETKNRGDVVEFYIERKVKGGFTRTEEWQQVELRRRTHHLQLKVIFPKGRPCKRAIVIQRSRNKVLVLGMELFRLLPDGRQLLAWETHHVNRYEVYTLKWNW